MLWIISGPSSVGKSTFLASPRCREVTGLGPETPVFFGFDVAGSDTQLTSVDCLFHYNLLRPAALFTKKKKCAQTFAQRLRHSIGLSRTADLEQMQRAAADFRSDPAWAGIIAQGGEKRAVLLIAERDHILDRVRARRQIEAHLEESYQASQWLALYEWLDLPLLYRAWYAELLACGIEPVLLDSHDPEFRPLQLP